MNYKIIGKYIKHLDFSIPNPKAFFLLSENISNYKINIDIKSIRVKQKINEIQVTLNLTPNKQDFEKINTKIVFATLIELSDEKMNKNELEKIVLIDVPSQIYGELRKIFVNLFENSGFRDVNISKSIDFKKLYDMKKVQ